MSRQKKQVKFNKKVFFNNSLDWLEIILNSWFFLFGLFLPIQLGKHWWPGFAFLNGVRIDYLSPSLFFTDLFLLIGFVLVVLTQPLEKPKLTKLSIFLISTTLLVLVVNFTLASYPELFFYRCWQYLKIGLVTIIFAKVVKSQWSIFIKGLFVASFYTLLLVIGQIVSQESIQGIWWWLGERAFSINSPHIATISWQGQQILRGYGTFSHPNSMAGFFLIIFWLFWLHKKRWASLIPLFLIVLSFSKIVILTLALTLFLWELRQKISCRFCHLAKLFFFGWLFVFTFMYRGSAVSISQRFISWQQTLLYLLNHPLGTSLGHYLHPLLIPLYQPVHNIWLLFLLELGWWGFFLLVFLFIWIYQAVKKRPVLFFIFFPLIIAGLFDHYWLTLVQNMLLVGVVFGYAITVLSVPDTVD